MLLSGERQVAPTLDGIRRDHRARYEWAARRLPPASRVLDLGCGVGYGAHILASAGHFVTAIDRDREAIDYARKHYAHPNIEFLCGDLVEYAAFLRHDAVVAFEIIEHLADPLPLLRRVRQSSDRLLLSVPNEDGFPFTGQLFHHRHYTAGQVIRLLGEAGFRATYIGTQQGPDSPVETGMVSSARTIVLTARPEAAAQPEPVMPAIPPAAAPAGIGHVAILGLGPSLEAYVDRVKRLGGRRKFCDQVWAINAAADVVQCDLVFHMDDVRVQALRAARAPDSNIAAMLAWLRTHPGPVLTSRAHPDFPGLVEFPLEAVINALGYAYFNSTAAYAVAFAIFKGASKLSLFGFDFTYANAHHAEQGRACVEFWLGIAAARGIAIAIPQQSSLMDAVDGPENKRLYGYDTLDIAFRPNGDGTVAVEATEKAPPSAEEIEARYDHSRHPSPLLRDKPCAA